MNDTYEYKIILKGKKNNCYAAIGTIPYQNLFIENEEVKGDIWEVLVSGFGIKKLNVKNIKKKPEKFLIPDDPKKAKEEFLKKYLDMSMHDRSKYFDLEIWVNSANADKGQTELLAHYIKGKVVDQDRPEEIELDDQPYIDSIDKKNNNDSYQIEDTDDYEEYEEVSDMLDQIDEENQEDADEELDDDLESEEELEEEI